MSEVTISREIEMKRIYVLMFVGGCQLAEEAALDRCIDGDDHRYDSFAANQS